MAVNLPLEPETRWHVQRPSPQALETALLVIGDAPLELAPIELTVTLDQGIEADWRMGKKALEIEILSDGSLEILRCVDGEARLESKLPKPDSSLLGEAFVWLAS